MDADLRRFTISVTPEMKEQLDKAKNENFCEKSQNAMLRDLIVLGLNSFEENKASNEIRG